MVVEDDGKRVGDLLRGEEENVLSLDPPPDSG